MTTIKQHEAAVSSYIENMILPSEPLMPLWNRENFIYSKPAKWNYIDACVIRAILMLYSLNGDKRLSDYAVRFTNAYISEDGTIPTMRAEDFNLDSINGGKNLLFLYRETGLERFRLAYEKLVTEQLSDQPRLMCGNFFHKAIYPDQIWLDGAYMTLPFMAEYSIISGKTEFADDAVKQLENIRDLMRDKNTGLYYHGYDESCKQKWADKKTGLSPQFWLRSIGWLCAGLTDICGILPSDSAGYSFCADMLAELLEALAMQTAEGGMLLQLPARHDLGENYPETSGTLLFAYSALRSARLGITGSAIKHAGEKAFSRVTEDFLAFDDPLPVMRNICLTAGLGGSPYRDGSAEYYLSERIAENDAKGIAPYIMTYTEIMR